MHRFWKNVIKPILTIEKPDIIVEIGAERGYNTKNIIEYIKVNGGVLYSIDPKPLFPYTEWEEENDGNFVMIKDYSLEVLSDIPPADVYLIDGDHNWYTVYNELCEIKKFSSEKFPLILFHDVAWPYGRRDIYYNPDNIPKKYLHGYANMGIVYGRDTLSDVEGINSLDNNCVDYGRPKIGVKTAIEDFVKDNSNMNLKFYTINALNGIGMLVIPESHIEAVEYFNSLKVYNEILKLTEEDRIIHTMAEVKAKNALKKLTKNYAQPKLYPDYGYGFDENTAIMNGGIDPENGEYFSNFTFDTPPQRMCFVPLNGQIGMAAFISVISDKGETLSFKHNGKTIGNNILFPTLNSQVIFENETQSASFFIRANIVPFGTFPEVFAVADMLGRIKELEKKCKFLEKDSKTAIDKANQRALKAEKNVRELSKNLQQYKSAANNYKAEANRHFNSFRYRIGTAVIEACRSPKKFIKLPFVILGIYKEYKNGQKEINQKKVKSSDSLLSVRTVNTESSVGVIDETGSFKLKEYQFSDFEGKYDEIMLNGVDIIIPIYNAYEELCECLNTLFENTDFPFNLVLINDCSTDERIIPLLEKYKDRENVKIYNNETNLGFVKTVNFGISHTDNNVVLLNSDTKLTPNWLRKLVIAGCSHNNTATVTPFSNAAGAFSVPEMGKNDDIPEGLSLEEMNILVERNSTLDYVQVPTGNGFCMYVARAAINSIGMFDYEAFSRGYGEENDFCMRSKNAGFCNLICDDTYIYHKRSASFKKEKSKLIEHNRKILDERYPEYSEEISIFKHDVRLISNRFRIEDAIKNNDGLNYKAKRILYVLHEGTGGTVKTNEDLMSFISSQNYETFMLTSDTSEFKLYQMADGILHLIYKWKLTEKWDINNFFCDQYKNIYFDVIRNFHIQLVHIRHLFKHSFDIVYVAEKLGVPVVFSLHDFYFICPTIQLINSGGKYCAGECRECDKKCRISTQFIKIEGNFSEWVQKKWRNAVTEMFGKCRLLITTSNYSKNLFIKIYPETADKFKIIEHGRNFDYVRAFLGERPKKDKIRILLAGNINYSKGEDYIYSLIKADKNKILEFHSIGSITESLRQYVTYHGKYRREEFVDFVREIKPSFVGIFSIWPETYCHVLTEAWSCGIPCIISDIGTLKERGEKYGGCVFADLNNPSETYKRIIDTALSLNNYDKLVEEALAAKIHTINKMGSQYLLSYDEILFSKKRPIVFWLSENTKKSVASTHIRVISPVIKNAVLRDNAVIIRIFEAEDIPETPGRKIVVIIQRDKISEESIKVLSDLKKSEMDLKIVLEIDDDLLSISRDHAEYSAYKPAIDKIRGMIDISDVIFTTTNVIAERLGDKCVVIPNYIDERLWTIKSMTKIPNKTHIGIIYTGSVTHQQDLIILKDVISSLKKRLEKYNLTVELSVVGCTDDNEYWYTKIPVPDKCQEYPEFAKWVNNLGEYDIAAAPLALDNHFNHAKSCLKYLEYSAMGIPGVYTDIEPYRAAVKDGVTGFLVKENNVDQWVECLYKLCISASLREKIAVNAQNDLRENYLLKDHFELIANELLK